MWMVFFFFKQKTAYEMRISDWSSDVCSSDLLQARVRYRLALRDLDDSRLDLETISERLGFSDRRSFTRAFTRWAGVTPSRYRSRRGCAPAISGIRCIPCQVAFLWSAEEFRFGSGEEQRSEGGQVGKGVVS